MNHSAFPIHFTGFNYAFDAYWMLPVGKLVLTRLVDICIKVCLNSHAHFTQHFCICLWIRQTIKQSGKVGSVRLWKRRVCILMRPVPRCKIVCLFQWPERWEFCSLQIWSSNVTFACVLLSWHFHLVKQLHSINSRVGLRFCSRPPRQAVDWGLFHKIWTSDVSILSREIPSHAAQYPRGSH